MPQSNLIRRVASRLLIILPLVAVGCRTTHPKVDATSVPKIVGGVALPAGHPGRGSAVMILHNNEFRCSGVLVASDLVMTAAHCLQNEAADGFSIVFGDSIDTYDEILPVKEFRQFRP